VIGVRNVWPEKPLLDLAPGGKGVLHSQERTGQEKKISSVETTGLGGGEDLFARKHTSPDTREKEDFQVAASSKRGIRKLEEGKILSVRDRRAADQKRKVKNNLPITSG